MYYRSKLLFRDHRTVVQTFRQFGELHTLLGDKYRAKAYNEAVRSLEAYEIIQLSQNNSQIYTCGKDVNILPGIGDKFVKKIDEILSTGKLVELEEAQKQPVSLAVKELTRVHGIGPITAVSLFKRNGVSTIDELRSLHAKSLENNESKPLLTFAQAAGLQYLDDIEKRIPGDEVKRHEQLLNKIVADVLGETAVVCGSYRRGLPTVGDVDTLVPCDLVGQTDRQSQQQWQAKMDEIMNRFQTADATSKHVYHIATLAQGTTKWMTISRLEPNLPARRVDLRFVPRAHFPAALLYFTGSKQFNIDMRSKAAAKGYLLNEYGLFKLHAHAKQDEITSISSSSKTKKKFSKYELQLFSLDNVPTVESDRVKASTEKDIFDVLEMEFIDPSKR